MKTNKATSNGHVKRKYKREISPAVPKGKWMRYGYGRFAKCLIVLIAEEYIGVGETYDRKFRSTGLSAKALFDRLTFFIPWIIEKYENWTGFPLTEEVVYHRWHKCVYTTRVGVGKSYSVGQSDEHPRNHLDLIPLLEKVEALFKRNKPIRQAEVQTACHEVGIRFGKIQ